MKPKVKVKPNPLSGKTPQDGDIFDLTLREVAAISYDAALQAKEEGLKNFFATYPFDPGQPSLTIDGVEWDLMASTGDGSEDDDDVWMWTGTEWEQISRF